MTTDHHPSALPLVTGPSAESERHSHQHTPAGAGRLQVALGLTVLILLVEVAGGWLANSLALLSDAAHMLTDLFALGLTWFALVQSRRPPDARRTFGYHRVSILAALLNAVSLVPIGAFIVWEAVGRLAHPPAVAGGLMFAVAAVGLVANLGIGLTLHGAAAQNLNIRSAVIHVLGDAVASLGVLVAASVIALTGWTPADPLLSIGIAVLVAVSGWQVVRETVRILLESVPRELSLATVAARMTSVAGVRDVHDLHIWQIGQGIYALSCHVLLDDQMVSQTAAILTTLNHVLEHEFHIAHSTIQPECAGCDPNRVYCSMSLPDGAHAPAAPRG